MNKNDLKQKLFDDKIPQLSYSLDGGLPNESYCLGQNGDVWEVYYSERGRKTNLKVFKDEESACNYFYAWLTKSLKNMGLID